MNPTRYVPHALAVVALVALVAVTAFAPISAAASPDTSTSGVRTADAVQTLDREARIPGTAWSVDPATGQVVVSYDDTVTEAKLARLTSVTARLGDAVRTERLPGVLSPLISGGDPIYSGGSRCTLGFNVRNSAGTQYFITAGHCTNVGSTWYADPNQTIVLGSRAGTSFPGNDFGIVRYTNTTISKPGNVNLRNGSYQDITSAGNATYNQRVCHVGSTSGYRCGYIIGMNATVNFPGGTVYGLYKSNICSEPGDSGGPMFAGTVALGFIVGGSGNCTTGGVTYYQPITEPLSVYGVSVY